jgi:tetratricopeptide (TPR) repeat protein
VTQPTTKAEQRELPGDPSNNKSGAARAAIDANTESFEIFKELIERDPGDISFRSEQIFALSSLVTIYTSIEQFSDATALAPKLLVENRELWKTGPDRIERLHGLAVALNTVGHLYIKVEEPEKAEPLFIEAEGIFGDLIDRVPTSDEFRRGLAMVRFGLAEAAYQRQQWTQAVDLYSEAIAAFLSQKAGLGLPDRG